MTASQAQLFYAGISIEIMNAYLRHAEDMDCPGDRRVGRQKCQLAQADGLSPESSAMGQMNRVTQQTEQLAAKTEQMSAQAVQ